MKFIIKLDPRALALGLTRTHGTSPSMLSVARSPVASTRKKRSPGQAPWCTYREVPHSSTIISW